MKKSNHKTINLMQSVQSVISKRFSRLYATDQATRHAIATILSILLFTGIFMIWIFSFSIISEVKATGFAVSEVKRQLVSHKDGGVLYAIYVKEGDSVEQGQQLASVTNLRIIEEQDKVTTAIEELTLEMARLEAEINDKAFEFQPGFDRKHYQQEMLVHQNRMSMLSSKIDVFNDQKTQYINRVSNLKVEQKLLSKEIVLVKQKWDTNKRLEKAGAGSHNKALTSEIELRKAQSRLHEIQSTLDQTLGKIAELDSQIKYEKYLTKQEMLAEQEAAQTEYKKKQAELTSMSQRYERQTVVAPVAGTIHRIFIDTIGSAVRSNQDIIEIIPEDLKLMVEANLDLDKRDQIWVGMKVSVIPPSNSSALFDPIIGKVVNISADSFLDQATNTSHFKVKVNLEKSNNAKFNALLHKGMQVSVRFETGEHTVAEYLGRPFLRGFRDALREPLT